MTERIDIKPFDLANEKITESISLYVELSDNWLMYVAEYYGEVPVSEDTDDHSLGWKDRYANFKIKVKRENICSLEKKWVHDRGLWMIEIEINGYPTSIHFQFKREADADKMYNKLDEYIFKK